MLRPMRAPLLAAVLVLAFLGSCSCDDGAAGSTGDGGAGGEGGDGGAGGGGGGSGGGGEGGGGSGGGGSGGGGAGGGGGAPVRDAFDAWRELQADLRASPDHLPARAGALVAARDVAGLHAFVRDEIAVYPGAADSFGNPVTTVRWGTRATLRGGAGTLREKAELLKELYERAGLEAAVVEGVPDASVDPRAILVQPVRRHFAPATTPAEAEELRELLGIAEGSHLPRPIDPDAAASDALADQLLALVPPSAPGPAFDFSIARMPLVRVVVDGAETFANPSVPGAAFGEPRTVDTPTTARGASPADAVEVLLEAAHSEDPHARFPLVERRFGADEVAGRTVSLSFAPAVAAAEANRVAVRDVTALVPVLAVRGDGLSDEEAAALSADGEPLTVDGARYGTGPGGEVLLDGTPLAQGPSDPARLAEVAELRVRLRAARFPHVELLVQALRADGTNVPGLAADAFRVADGGVERPALVRRTRAPPPRILFLFDRSASIPPAYLDQAADFGHSIAAPVLAEFPGAQVRVAGLAYTRPSYAGPWVSTIEEVDAQLAALGGVGSELWANLAELAKERPTLVVLVTDGDVVPEDALEARERAAIASGAPVLAIGVGPVVPETFETVVSLTGGEVLYDVDPPTAAAATLERIRDHAVEDYRLTYEAPLEGPAPRPVALAFDGGRLSAEASYEPPAVPAPPPGLVGLYLTVRAGGHQTTRTLVGFDELQAARPEVPEAALREARGALFGRWTIAFEAGPAPLSVLLDRRLEERLRAEAGWDAAVAGDEAGVQAAHERPLNRTPADLLAFAAALPRARQDALTFPTGLRVAVASFRPVFGERSVRALDVLALAPYRTAHDDPAVAYELTLRRTAFVGVLESGLRPLSTRALLEGLPLAAVDPLDAGELGDAWHRPVAPYRGGYTLVAPTGGAPLAFWAIDDETGTVLGILPDGSGGAAEVEQALEDTLTILDMVGRAGEALGYGPAFEAWISLEEHKAKALANATLVLLGEEGRWVDDFAEHLCDQVDEAIGEAVPPLGALMGYLDDLESAAGAFELVTGAETPDLPSIGVPCP